MKPIKFNLSYGDERIKTLDELKASCNVDMLLETLQNGLLVRWLMAQGETALAEKVGAISTDNYRKALSELLKVLFGKEADVYEQAAAVIFAVREKEAQRLENLKNLADEENKIIEQYHKKYSDLLVLLQAKKNDYPALKALVETLYKQYRGLLALDKVHFYDTFKSGYPLVLLSIMANEQLREFIGYDGNTVYNDVVPKPKSKKSAVELKWKEISDAVYHGRSVPVEVRKLDTQASLKEFKEKYKGRKLYPFNYNTMYEKKRIPVSSFNLNDYYCPSEIEEQIQAEQALKTLPAHVKVFSGKTDQYWKDLEAKGKTFMIISMENGNKLRNAGANGEEFSADDINGKFIFTDGIDYMSNSDTDKLIYMEV